MRQPASQIGRLPAPEELPLALARRGAPSAVSPAQGWAWGLAEVCFFNMRMMFYAYGYFGPGFPHWVAQYPVVIRSVFHRSIAQVQQQRPPRSARFGASQ